MSLRFLLALPLAIALASPVATSGLGIPAVLAGSGSASAADAGVPGEVRLEDPSGDVILVPAGQPAPAPQLTDGVDLVQARLYGETGEYVWIEFTLKNYNQEAQFPQSLSQGVELWGCLGLNGKTFAVRIYIISMVLQGSYFGLVNGACSPAGATFVKYTSIKSSVIIDAANNQVRATFGKMDFYKVTREATPEAGAQLTGFYAVVRDPRGLRTDPAGPADKPLTLIYPTANQDLKLLPNVNIRFPIPCHDNKDLPTYAIEAGGKRGIPITVSNRVGSARDVVFSVGTVLGTDWRPKMMPGIQVPAADGTTPGNVTVNVILDTPSTTKHRECATLRVRATDPANPSVLGETSLNLVSVVPPSPTRNVLSVHAGAGASTSCDTQQVWMNVDPNDPADAKSPIRFRECGGENPDTPPSLTASGLTVHLDVNPSYDLVLNTTAVGKKAVATARFRSDNAPTHAEITLLLGMTQQATFQVLAESKKVVDLSSTPTTVTLDLPIQFTREVVANGDPSRVVDAADRLGLSIRYRPLPLDENAGSVRPAGTVYFLPEGSSVTLPIWSTIKRNVNDPGAAGGLVSLKALDALEGFANPGKVRVFNFTVLNEGATSDAALISATVNGGRGNWTTQVVPAGPIALGPGQPAKVVVGITPPLDAKESEHVRLDVLAVSQSDPTARATVSVVVTATQGQLLPDQTLVDAGPIAKKKGVLPGPPLELLVVALLGVAWARRSLGRRRED